MATREVPHVLGMKGNLMHFVQEQFGAENLTKGVTVEVTDDNRVVVNISVIIEYGAYAPAIFDDVKARVTERLAAMTGLEVAQAKAWPAVICMPPRCRHTARLTRGCNRRVPRYPNGRIVSKLLTRGCRNG